MRTAITFGAMIIADAINKDWQPITDGGRTLLFLIILVFFIMDFVEFLKRISK